MKLLVEVGDKKVPWGIYRWWFDSEKTHRPRFEGYKEFTIKIEVDGEIIFEKTVSRPCEGCWAKRYGSYLNCMANDKFRETCPASEFKEKKE